MLLNTNLPSADMLVVFVHLFGMQMAARHRSAAGVAGVAEALWEPGMGMECWEQPAEVWGGCFALQGREWLSLGKWAAELRESLDPVPEELLMPSQPHLPDSIRSHALKRAVKQFPDFP